MARVYQVLFQNHGLRNHKDKHECGHSEQLEIDPSIFSKVKCYV